jgi:hypothetical protein
VGFVLPPSISPNPGRPDLKETGQKNVLSGRKRRRNIKTTWHASMPASDVSSGASRSGKREGVQEKGFVRIPLRKSWSKPSKRFTKKGNV